MLSDVDTNALEQCMEQGNEYLQQKKPQQALLYFNSAVLLAPEHIEALICCAETLINLNRAAEAAVYSRRALQLRSTPNILILHAKALYQMGEYNKALDCFERVITKEPNNPTALGQRALCLTQVNRYDEALEAYQHALACSTIITLYVYWLWEICFQALLPTNIAGARSYQQKIVHG